MLVLARKKSQTIRVGRDVEILVVRIGTDRVSLGITAPQEMVITRGEAPRPQTAKGEQQ